MERATRPGSQAGMTLVEILVSLTIFAIVIGALTTILFSSTRLGTRTASRADIQGACRQTMSLMSTEIRQAGADPRIPPIGVVGVVYADSVTLRTRGDISGDGVIQTTEPSEDVTYSYVDSTGTLQRNPGTGAVNVLENITGLRFAYYDATNALITPVPLSATNAALVRSVGITITGRQGDAEPFTISSRIMLRNR